MNTEDMLDKPVTVHLEDLLNLLDCAGGVRGADFYKRIDQIADLVAQGIDQQTSYDQVMLEDMND